MRTQIFFLSFIYVTALPTFRRKHDVRTRDP